MISTLVLSFILTATAAAHADKDECRLGFADLNRAKIKILVENPACGVFSPEDFLAKVPGAYFEQNALVYQSRSLQGPHEVDYLSPRAIVFGRAPDYSHGQPVFYNSTNTLIFSFNGRAGQAAHNSVEFVELDPKGGADGRQFFKYFDVTWPARSGQGVVSEFNPRKCVACHGDPAKPIFSVYPHWKGVYGSEKFKDDAVVAEMAHYKEFAALAVNHPRYRFLRPAIQTWPENPNDYYRLTDDFTMGSQGLEAALEAVNKVRVIRLLRASPQYSQTRYAIMGSLVNCSNWPSFLPRTTFAALEANMRVRQFFSPADVQSNLLTGFGTSDSDFRNLEEYAFKVVHSGSSDPSAPFERARVPLVETEARMRKVWGANEFFFDLLTDTLKAQGPGHDNPSWVGIRMLMEGRGLEIGSYFLELVEPTYRTHNGGGHLTEEAEELVKQDPVFSRYHIDYKADYRKVCEDLRDASLDAMKGLKVPPLGSAPVLPQPYPQVFLNTCASCDALPDAERGDLPYIPYDNPAALESALNRSPRLKQKIWEKIHETEGYQMPPYRMLGPEEIKSIESYLQR